MQAGGENGVTASGSSRAGDSPALKGNPILRHPDINLQPQYDRLQNDLMSEVLTFLFPPLDTSANSLPAEKRFQKSPPR